MKEFLKSGKVLISAALTLLGAVAATIGILQFTETKPSEIWIVERDGTPIDISPNSGGLREVYQADIVNVLGDITADEDIAIIANEIVFKDGASLRAAGANITLIATRIRGGEVSVSGAAADVAGAAGRAGGSIYAVAALLDGIELRSNGGAGGKGNPGEAGADGEELTCSGGLGLIANRALGHDERPANDGEEGKEGAPGGPGGKGGVVKVFGHPGLVTTVKTDVSGGEGGTGGEGGPGGKGAPGCGQLVMGDEGDEGRQGPAGERGPKGLSEVLNFDFRTAGPALKKKLKSIPSSAAAARRIAEFGSATGLAE